MILVGDLGALSQANRAVDVSESKLHAQSLHQTLLSRIKLTTVFIAVDP